MKKKIQKPFDVEAAKNGAKIETKSGYSVRILCYDKVGDLYPIVALINISHTESCYWYTSEGKLYHHTSDELDLVIVEEVEVSKFNVGDWIFRDSPGASPLLIVAITSNCYMLQDLQGHKGEISRIAIDRFYRLWTIKDAKPGDILIYESNKCSFIFKEFSFGGAPSAYCSMNAAGYIFIGTGGPWLSATVRLATYKERQQFLKKMKEEGYKWDDRTLTLWKKM